MLDLDNFKDINDYYGHQAGDTVLKVLVQRIKEVLKKRDFIARIGGDEFIIFLESIDDYNSAGAVAKRIIHFSEKPFDIDGSTVKTSLSIGIACYPTSGKTYDNLA